MDAYRLHHLQEHKVSSYNQISGENRTTRKEGYYAEQENEEISKALDATNLWFIGGYYDDPIRISSKNLCSE